MKQKNIFFIPVLLMLLVFVSCKDTSIECKDAHIEIENRWYDENGGVDYFEVKDKNDISFICGRINGFPKGKDVRIAYSYGYIYLNNRKVQCIFTYENGIVYRVGIGKYVYDEVLTKRIMKLMKITNRCWGKECK